VQNKEKQLTLAAVGVISLASAARADEKMSQLQTALSNTTISGYVDTAAQWSPGSDQNVNGGPFTPGYSFAKNDGFTVNAVDIAIDKPEDAGSWASGYHVELMAGPNAAPGASLFGASATSAGAVGIRQAYVVVRTPLGANGIDWKVGVWDTIIGYEGTSDPTNPNYTRSYGYSIEPTSHTGIQGTYKVNDALTIQVGVADSSNVGNGTAFNTGSAIESQKAYMGAIALTAPKSWGFLSGATLNAGVINADGPAGAAGFGSTSYYVGTTIPTPLAALKFGTAFDYLDLHNGGKGNSSDDSVWVGGLYATYQATDKLSLNLRGEYVDTAQLGASDIAAFGAGAPGTLSFEASDDQTRNAQAIEEITATVQYALWTNVLSRVEFRWDHVDHGNAFGAPTTAGGLPTKGNDFLLALNLIYQF
jgi:hypothetical protein